MALVLGLLVAGTACDATATPRHPLAYMREQPRALVLVERDGRQRVLAPGLDQDREPGDPTDCRLHTVSGYRWSPDGTRIAYAGWAGLRAVVVDGSEGCTDLTARRNDREPVWSPDGTRIVFERLARGDPPPTGTALHVIGRDGNSHKQVTELVEGRLDRHATWSPDSRHLAFQRAWLDGDQRGTRILVVEVAEGSVRSLTTVTGGLRGGTLRWSPSGRWLAFATERAVRVVSVDGDGARRYRPDGRTPEQLEWSPRDDQLAVLADGRVYLLDPERRMPRRIDDLTSVRGFAWSPDGARLAVSGSEGRVILRFDIDSGETSRLAAPRESVTLVADPFGAVGRPKWSPDGRSVTFVAGASKRNLLGIEETSSDVFVVDVDGSDLRQITDDGSSLQPSFRP